MYSHRMQEVWLLTRSSHRSNNKKDEVLVTDVEAKQKIGCFFLNVGTGRCCNAASSESRTVTEIKKKLLDLNSHWLPDWYLQYLYNKKIDYFFITITLFQPERAVHKHQPCCVSLLLLLKLKKTFDKSQTLFKSDHLQSFQSFLSHAELAFYRHKFIFSN